MTENPPHHPVMLHEVIEALQIKPGGIYIDGTFGRGGHSRHILKHLNQDGRLICLDKDPQAIAFGQSELGDDPRVSFFQTCFSHLSQIVEQCGVKHHINGILLDLGVSSPQLDEASRGFSFMKEGPLDMRMDTTRGFTASDWLKHAELKEIAFIIKKYGEEPFAKRIARKIGEVRETQPITTTSELAALVASCLPRQKNHRHPATKTFQAIRIHVNQELAAIDKVLGVAQDVLAPMGRLAMISFHSLEDRIVKQYFRDKSRIRLPPGVSIPEKDLFTDLKWVVKRLRPSEAEIEINQRARSAQLRVAEKHM